MTNGDPHHPSLSWYRRLHAALMPDYNRPAVLYWWLATASGSLLLLWCVRQVSTLPAWSIVQVGVGILFALGAGLFPVRIPGTRVSFGVGELTIFLILLLMGPAAATVLAAAEAALGSYRTSRRWTSRLGSPAMATLAMFAAASLFEAGRGALQVGGEPPAVPLLALALVVGLVYFVLSATLMGGVARLRRNEHLLRPSDLFGAFRWVGLAYAGSAMFATLLYIAYLQAGAAVFAVTLPLLAMLLLVLHFFYRQQEAQETMRAALADIARREGEIMAREEETAALHEREMQLSERRFRGAFTLAAIGMALLDLEGRIIQPNEALSRMLGLSSDDLVGAFFARMLHPDDRDIFVSRLAKARDLNFEEFEQEIRLLDEGGNAQRAFACCSFFSGPAAHGGATAGKPCLMLQIQTIERPTPPTP